MTDEEIDQYLNDKMISLLAETDHKRSDQEPVDEIKTIFNPDIDSKLVYTMTYKEDEQNSIDMVRYQRDLNDEFRPLGSDEVPKAQTLSYRMGARNNNIGVVDVGFFKSTLRGYINTRTNTAYIQNVSTSPKMSGNIGYSSYYISNGGKRAVLTFRNNISYDDAYKYFSAGGRNFYNY